MTTMRQIQTHKSVMRSHQGLIYLEICRTPTQALNVDTPLLRVQVKCFECSLLTCELDGIDVLVTTVVSCSRVPFGVLIGHG